MSKIQYLCGIPDPGFLLICSDLAGFRHGNLTTECDRTLRHDLAIFRYVSVISARALFENNPAFLNYEI